MSAVAALKKAQTLWVVGKMEEMSQCYAENAMIQFADSAYPELNQVFKGQSGCLEWIARIHQRFIFHDAHFGDYAESEDKSTCYCSFTNYTTDATTGKKDQTHFMQRVKIDTATGLITNFTMATTNASARKRQTTLYGITRTTITFKEGSKAAVEALLQDIGPEVFRIDGMVALNGYFANDTTYISMGAYRDVASAKASLTDSTRNRVLATFREFIVDFDNTVTEGAWLGADLAVAGPVFAAASTMYLKPSASQEIFAPNGMWGEIQKFPGFTGMIEVRHNDNYLEAVAFYKTQAQAEAAGELAKPFLAQWRQHFASAPERVIYPGWSFAGDQGFLFFHDVTFKNEEDAAAWVEYTRHAEGESNFAVWQHGELTYRALGCYSNEGYDATCARYNATPEKLKQIIGSFVSANGVYTGAIGRSEKIFNHWNSFDGISVEYAKPLHSNITVANISAEGAFAYTTEFTFHSEEARTEFINASKAHNDTAFDFLAGSRQESSAWYHTGSDGCTVVSFTNKATFEKDQARFAKFPATHVNGELVKKIVCTVVGDVDEDVRANMAAWDTMPFVTVKYVPAHPASVLRF